MNKRHAKPTSAQLVARIYRKQIAMEALINGDLDAIANRLEAIESGQAMLSQRMESFRVLADHCARLLREKETLMKIARPELERRLRDSEAYMSKPMGNGPRPCPQGEPIMSLHTEAEQLIKRFTDQCMFATSHRIGVPCAICGFGYALGAPQ